MQREIFSGIYRHKEILVKEECAFVYDELQERMIEGFVKEYAYQKQRIGELVAYKEEGSNKVFIGFAVMHPEDMKHGYLKATTREKARLVAGNSFDDAYYVNKLGVVGIPHIVREDVAYFILRVKKYFREVVLPDWATTLYNNHFEEY